MRISLLDGFLSKDAGTVLRYQENHDFKGLISLLKMKDSRVSEAAADALVSAGPEIIDLLLGDLRSSDTHVRLEIIGILSKIGDLRAIDPLVSLLLDPVNEVRWQSAIALGEIRSPCAVPPLVAALQDADKYVRYGAGAALTRIGWIPENDHEKALLYIAVQDWHAVKNLGDRAVPALSGIFHDQDPVIRQKIIKTLGDIGNAAGAPVILRALGDADRDVRWQAVLASRKCSVPLLQLPRALAQRPNTRKSPAIAGFLNFMLPGLGYGYLGKWWGIMIFQVDITATVWLFKYEGESSTFLILLPLYLVLAGHAWYLADTMPDDPP
jgi:HEAT repeat protein